MRLIALVMLLALPVTGADVLIMWDASTATNVVYKVYGRTTSLTDSNRSTASIQVLVGTNLSAILSGVTATPRFFGITAVQNGTDESLLSNVIELTVPLPATNLRTNTPASP